jgi:hypothetical protein
MTDDKLIDLWSEDDLDRALGALHDDVDTGNTSLAETRAAFLATIGEPADARTAGRPPQQPVRRKRRMAYSLVAAAAVIALVTTGFLVTASGPGGSAEAKAELNASAEHINVKDPVVPPGKYTYRVDHSWQEAWYDNGGKQLRVLQEFVSETWIPANRADEWIQRSSYTGRHQWVTGSEQEAAALGIKVEQPDPKVVKANCGDFAGSHGGCDFQGSWGDPTPAWIAGLPTDPKALYERLKEDAPHNLRTDYLAGAFGRGDNELVVYARDALRSGLLPAAIRADLYRALGYIDNLEISGRAVNLDGKSGVAYSTDSGKVREEIIIDPATGEYIGGRTIGTSGEDRNRVSSFSSVTTTIVDHPFETH